ncbi:hypothetical protein ONZ45_g989 [Pleurotus djamor]|nr:hypothetical protein ONZ45_g989 [Pleurotus djamor]
MQAPTNITDITDMNIEIRLLIPQSSSVQKLATYLPGLDQTFGALDYSFDQVNVEGARSDMIFRSLRADKLFIKNALGPITGVFNVTNSLHLDNIGGLIDVNTTLVHDSSHDSATFMSIDNGNADVRAKVTLSSPQKHSILPTPKPRFEVHVKTFDEPILLDVLYDPSTAAAPLSLAVQNNLGDVNVTVDAKYEGTFDAATKLDKTTIVQTPVDSWYDPASLGRTFRYEYDYKSTNRAFGWVGWGGRVKLREDILSNIAVVSAMNPVSLSFRETYSQSTTRTRR